MAHESELIQQRMHKLDQLKQKGINPYNQSFKKSSDISEAIKDFKDAECSGFASDTSAPRSDAQNSSSIRGGQEVSFAGRLMAVRSHGKSAFADLMDATAKVQIYVKLDPASEENFNNFQLLDIGDIIGVKGGLFKTRTGEPTVAVKEFVLLSKNLRPLPEKWHGLKDIETRFRQRYVDLIMSKEVKELFILRSKIISEIRKFLDTKGYLEVETPMMQSLAGGAVAKPFETYHNALDMKLYLRIAPELYLKRLLVGGYEKVYEINRNFRNEGISTKHNPEFTMLEVYTAYADYKDVMTLTEMMILDVAEKVLGTTKIQHQDKTIDLSVPWKKISFYGILKEKTGVDFRTVNIDQLKKIAAKLDVEFDNTYTDVDFMDKIFEKTVEPALLEPTFVVDYPAKLCPLAKKKQDDAELTERFELYIGGQELANAYSELNDPVEQRKRFSEQALHHSLRSGAGQGGNIDEDFLRSLEYGMPPAGGLGVGIDRLVMFLSNRPSIREVILFPHMRPEGPTLEKDK